MVVVVAGSWRVWWRPVCSTGGMSWTELAEADLGLVEQWATQLDELGELIGPRFFRPEPRERALGYVKGLLSPVAGVRPADAQGRRRVCGYARDRRLDMAVGRSGPEEGTMKQSHYNRSLLGRPPDPVRLAGRRANTTPADTNSAPTISTTAASIDPGRPHAAHCPLAAVATNPDPAASPGGNPDSSREAGTNTRDDADIAPGCVTADRVDRPYAGKSTMLKEDDYVFIQGSIVATPPTRSRAHTGPTIASAARRYPA